jgi:hypothetical protein
MSLMDIIGSTLLAGVVIVAILGMNLLVSDSSRAIGADLNTQQSMVEFTKTLQWDLAKIGHRDTTKVPVLVARPDSLKYMADVDDDGRVDTVFFYKGGTSSLSSTPNPYDFLVYKVVRRRLASSVQTDTMKLNVGFTQFQFTYFDSTGAQTTNRLLVRGLKVTTKVENKFANADGIYAATSWENTIYPRNLNVKK